MDKRQVKDWLGRRRFWFVQRRLGFNEMRRQWRHAGYWQALWRKRKLELQTEWSWFVHQVRWQLVERAEYHGARWFSLCRVGLGSDEVVELYLPKWNRVVRFFWFGVCSYVPQDDDIDDWACIVWSWGV